MTEQWTKMSLRFQEWGSPLRPSAEDVQLFKNEIEPGSKTLLLGVTAELQPLATIAIDNNPEMIAAYKADAILGDWADLPFGPDFDAVMGDGSLNAFQGRSEHFFEQATKVLTKEGRLLLRVFISPETKEDLEFVFSQKEKMGFHAFKWRVAHAVANPYVAVKELYRLIKPVYDHPTLEVYKDSSLIYYFPKLSELPTWETLQFGSSYELAERCPVITWKKR